MTWWSSARGWWGERRLPSADVARPRPTWRLWRILPGRRGKDHFPRPRTWRAPHRPERTSQSVCFEPRKGKLHWPLWSVVPSTGPPLSERKSSSVFSHMLLAASSFGAPSARVVAAVFVVVPGSGAARSAAVTLPTPSSRQRTIARRVRRSAETLRGGRRGGSRYCDGTSLGEWTAWYARYRKSDDDDASSSSATPSSAARAAFAARACAAMTRSARAV